MILGSIKTRIHSRLRDRWLRKNFRNGKDFINALRGHPEPHAAVRRDGRTISHPPVNGFVDAILECWYRNVYFPPGFYKGRAGDVIVDAGANIGLFSLLALDRFPAARIVAIEPFPENFQFLTQNLRRFFPDNRWKAYSMALGDSAAGGTMERVGERSLDHILRSTPSTTGISVETLRLDAIFERAAADRIAFFKMDIEGSERAVIETASDQTLNRIDHIAAEYHDNLVPGCLKSLERCLSTTHSIRVVPAPMLTCGMLFAKRKSP